VEEAEFKNFAGFEYYNKGLSLLKHNKITEAYELLQKAYFFFPDSQVENVLYYTLIQLVEECKFSKIEDMDYLAQLSRFKSIDESKIVEIFLNIVKFNLQYIDKIKYCDSMSYRLIQNVPDKNLKREISLEYNLLMGRHFKSASQMNDYIEKAIAIRQNHLEANRLFFEYLEEKLNNLSGYNELIDSIDALENRYKYEFVKPLFSDYRLIACLNEANRHFSYNRIDEGINYLKNI
jgi:hypothetical protein